MEKIRWLLIAVLVAICGLTSCTSRDLARLRLKFSADRNGTWVDGELLPYDPLFIEEKLMGP